MTNFFTTPSGRKIAYSRLAARDKSLPGVIFLHGFRSDMTGEKALYLEDLCRKSGQGFLRFDYSGHGQSGGDFEAGGIGPWSQDAIAVFDALTEGPQIVVGSSMGGWISLLLALRRPERVAGLVGIAAAPDFTEDVYHRELTEAQRREIEDKGSLLRDSDWSPPYRLMRGFFEDGKNHLLLHADIPLACPVHLLHSKMDEVVPWRKAEEIKARLTSSPDVKVTLLEDGDHRLSRPQDLELLGRVVAEMSNPSK